MKRLEFAFAFLTLLSLGAVTVLAQPSFDRYSSELPGFRLELRTRTQDAEQTPHQLFSDTLLVESGFRRFSDWTVHSEESAAVEGEVFEMNSSVGAYALFNHALRTFDSTSGISLDLPVGNRFTPQGAVFWRGNLLFYLLPTTGNLQESVFSDFVRAVADTINLENLLPVSVSHLPRDDRVPGSVRFYLGSESLAENPRFPEPLIQEIGLSDKIEIAEARFEPGGHSLFVVGYPTPSLADQYLVRMQNRLRSFFSKEGIYMKRSGVLIGIFIGPEEQARRVLGELQYKPTVQWFKKEEEEPKDRFGIITFAGSVTKAILGTGTLLLMIIGGGLLAGLARYGLFRAFPRILHRKDMIRLKLR